MARIIMIATCSKRRCAGSDAPALAAITRLRLQPPRVTPVRMHRLLLLRHAKAERPQPGQTDHDRALTKSGHKDSVAMGGVVVAQGGADLVLCSDSVRTRETWEGARRAFSEEPETRLLRTIYEADETYLPILKAEGGDAHTILVIGHNPAIHETALLLASDLASEAGQVLSTRFPKAALAVLDSETPWDALAAGGMRLRQFILPPRPG